MTVGIAGGTDDTFPERLADIINKSFSPGVFRTKVFSTAEDVLRCEPDAVVFCPKFLWKKEMILPETIAIAYDNSVKCVGKQIYTYGIGGENHITCSSLDRGKMVICLRNDIVCAGGKTVEAQEIPLSEPDDMTDEEFLAAVSALVVLGLPTEKLKYAL